MKRLVAISIMFLATSAGSFADDVQHSRQLQREASAALQADDFPLFLQKISAAKDLRPTHPTLLMLYAGALALNGREEDALSQIERVGRMGMVYAPEKEPMFRSLLTSPRFIAATETFRANAAPAGAAKVAFTVPRKGLITEGLARDPVSGTFYVGSVRQHAVFAVKPHRSMTKFVELPLGAFGMAVDARHGVLWVASSSLPQVAGFNAASSDRAAVVKVNLRTGRILETFDAPEGKHLFGDLTVASDGDVYVTDSTTPAIYRLHSGKLEEWFRGEPFIALQGLAFSEGDRILYVSDYSKGLYAIDVRTRDAAALTVPSDATLLGVDGIYRSGTRTLIGVQNGTDPNRIVRIELGADGLSVKKVTSLAANRAPMEDPTLGVMAGTDFYFNGAGQWELFDDTGKVKDETSLHEGVVLRVPVR
ncbi:MAG: hypothetical protein ABI718_04845 [Acidobacteriota bacterium]